MKGMIVDQPPSRAMITNDEQLDTKKRQIEFLRDALELRNRFRRHKPTFLPSINGPVQKLISKLEKQITDYEALKRTIGDI